MERFDDTAVVHKVHKEGKLCHSTADDGSVTSSSGGGSVAVVASLRHCR